MDYQTLADQIKAWGVELGFQQVGICDVDLSEHEENLQRWLDAGYYGVMNFFPQHGMLRTRPDELLPGTVRVISVRMDYLPPNAQFAANLREPTQGYISRYSLGRDYHKVVRNQLKKLGQRIEQECGQLGYRPFVDTAPILEKPLAEKAGLGWRGKHSLLLNQSIGSWFFLGELLVDIPLPVDIPALNQCGKCSSCITACPTNAIVAEGVIDARRCISYLTQYDGVIPVELRSAMGNRIYGCDDCQLVCPFNRESEITKQSDFHRRSTFEDMDLLSLFAWTEEEFLTKMQGSAIRRIGHLNWLRNISIALGNAPYSQQIITALEGKIGIAPLLDEHIQWALEQQYNKLPMNNRKTERLIRIIEKGLPRDA